jgi:voltage-gated sodium channel
MSDEAQQAMATKSSSTMSSRLLEHPWFERFITGLIILNAFTICFETYQSTLQEIQTKYGLPLRTWFDFFDLFVIIVFSIEVLMRLVSQGKAFWKDNWNIFDFIILSISIVGQSPFFTVLRVIRIIRALRLLSQFKTLRLITSVIAHSITGCIWITLLMLMVLIVFAVIGNELYGATNPALFGNLHLGMHTLFRVAAVYTYDDVASQLIGEHPYVYAFLLPYFMIMGYIVINFFSGIVVYYLYEVSFDELKTGERQITEAEHEASAGDQTSQPLNEVLLELKHLRQEIATLKEDRK